MKKSLLLIGALALSAVSAMADVHTLTFDGDNATMYGLTRQITTNPTEFVQEWSFTEEGIDFKIENTGTGKGLALVNAIRYTGGQPNPNTLSNVGLYTSSNVNITNSLTVPGGKITKVKIIISGSSLLTQEMVINGTTFDEPSILTNPNYGWNWTDDEGAETVTMTWKSAYAVRYIHSIEVTYTKDLGGKEECGLAFSATDAEGVIGEAFTAPTLTNPHNLPVTWSSSSESVATVNAAGVVTLLAAGTTTITAATVGNDSYAEGNAKYQLTVIPQASNLKQMLQVAPEVKDRVKVNCPLTVTYASGSQAFVIDAQNNASQIRDTKNDGSTSATGTIYKVGQVIPAGWIATNATSYEDVLWSGLPATSTETVEVVYPEVETVTPADADRVVILKNVTFSAVTPVAESKTWVQLPNGSSIEVQNLYNAPSLPAGTYDVTCVVFYSKRGSTVYFYVCPLAYTEVPEPVFPESFDVTLSSELATVTQGYDQGVYTIKVSGECEEDELKVTLGVPEGWDGFIGLTSSDYEPEVEPFRAAAADPEWAPIDAMLQFGLKKGNILTFAADGEEYQGQLYLYKGDQVDAANQIAIEVNVTKKAVEPDPVFPTTLDVTADQSGVTITQGYDEDMDALQLTVGGKVNTDKVTLTFALPEGWEGVLAVDMSMMMMSPRKAKSEWPTLDQVEANFDGLPVSTGNTLTLDADGGAHMYQCMLYTPDHLVDAEHGFVLVSSIAKTNTGIEAIEAESAPARYYNMQGIEVEHPVNGAFIKVKNGKAAKVTVK